MMVTKAEAQAKVAAAEKTCEKVQAAWSEAPKSLGGSVSVNGYGISHDRNFLCDKLPSAQKHINEAL